MLGLKAGQHYRQLRLDEAVAAVFGYHQTSTEGVQCADGLCVAEREAVGTSVKDIHVRVVRGLGGLDQTGRFGHRLATETSERESVNQACPEWSVVSRRRRSWARHISTHRSGCPMP